MWPGVDGPEADEADSTNTAGTGSLLAPIYTNVTIPEEEENPFVLSHARHVLAPSVTTLLDEHWVLASDLMSMRDVRECVSLDKGPHKTVVGYFHKHLK